MNGWMDGWMDFVYKKVYNLHVSAFKCF